MKLGLKFILQASAKLGADENAIEKSRKLIEKYGADCPYDIKELLPLVKNDKKAESDVINAVFVKDIGECFVKKISFEDFERLFG